jgi:hypothetical protein
MDREDEVYQEIGIFLEGIITTEVFPKTEFFVEGR